MYLHETGYEQDEVVHTGKLTFSQGYKPNINQI